MPDTSLRRPSGHEPTDLRALVDRVIAAARQLPPSPADGDPAMILAGFRGQWLTALTCHPGAETSAPIGLMDGVDSAVLIVVGTPRRVGAVLLALSDTTDALHSAGVSSISAIHCRVLEPGAVWTDLTDTLGRDGLISSSATPPRRASAGRNRLRWRRMSSVIAALALLALLLLLGSLLLQAPLGDNADSSAPMTGGPRLSATRADTATVLAHRAGSRHVRYAVMEPTVVSVDPESVAAHQRWRQPAGAVIGGEG
ncbi:MULTISPECIES: hypothetical protein [Nocardia]|uniref:hypothetical protein n=1 Tax=Nocardia TaxID=1817 RepID=UPI000FD84E7F|nr:MULTISPECIES: hypothetical protein [Nocardia]MBF6188851.1 hypothetical protein [Nocardia farcinica]MBF6260117.1 hypothetical protein [Nocardia farcinica]MBF6294616.1 hypothetical protein [Nocardia farcinica]MBF6314024.1 hypothetical protein [Nocardia farcinica]MBF6381788.1 hypothetical protein [Nocardia farcinica]